jgi:hypothetical protein
MCGGALLKNFLRHLFLVFGCLHLVGGPYCLVQVYAWANMLVSYSQETSLSRAVTDTFSGEKPCCLCKEIAAAKDDGQEQAPLAPLTAKLFQDLFPPSHTELKDPFPSPFPHPGFEHVARSVSPPSCGPPSPPPRC